MPVHTEPVFFGLGVIAAGYEPKYEKFNWLWLVIDAFIDVFTKFMSCFEGQVQYLNHMSNHINGTGKWGPKSLVITFVVMSTASSTT